MPTTPRALGRTGVPGLGLDRRVRPAILLLAGCLATAPLTPVTSAQARGVLGPVSHQIPLFVRPAASTYEASGLIRIQPPDSSRGSQWLGAGMAFGLAFGSIGLFTGALGCEGGFANQDCIHHIALGGLIGGAVGFGLGAFVGSFIPKADPAAGAPSEPD